jgi:hypothetical protein
VRANRQDNLYTPVAGDDGVHGQFGEHARAWSWQCVLALADFKLAVLMGATLLRAAVRRGSKR